MPDPPEEKRSRLINEPTQAQPTGPGLAYAELHCKTNFSFLEGASHADELVLRAAELGYQALAITDRNSLAGVVRAHGAAKQVDLKLLIGAEITPADAPAVVLLATDRLAYGRLSRLITRGRRNASKGECRLNLADLADHAEGLLAGVLYQPPFPEADSADGLAAIARYREIFGDRCYWLVELHLGPRDRRRLEQSAQLAKKYRIPLVASGGVHFHHPSRQPLCDVLTATRAGCTVREAGELLFPNAERYLKTPRQIYDLFTGHSAAVRRTIEVADRCQFVLDELRYEYPEELAPPGQSPLEYLIELTWQGAHVRYPAGVPGKVRQLLQHELTLIAELRYEAYFLTVWDLVRYARSREILCQGRGSAANSAVCYCLGITEVDPDRMDVLFERFLSRERNEAPDIDVDFEHQRREEVLQYIYEKYGRERAGMTAEVITYRPKSAVRDIGKALGLSLDRVDALAKIVDGRGGGGAELAHRAREIGVDPDTPMMRTLFDLVRQLLGFPRHLGQHVGGMVMTQGPLCELVPIENATMPGRTVIQWDKDDLDELGILKVDCLALGMLTALHRCFDLVHRHDGRQLTLADLREDEAPVYDMICRADTMGVFQIESRAQMSMLPRLRPREFYDLVVEVAIVRPGPIQGNMVHPYLRRRAGQEEITYPNDEIREVLKKTLGVPLFQEQAMRLAVVAAGFTPGEADQLRRAMGAWRRPGIIETFRKKLIDGMLAKGLSAEFAEHVFRQIRGFGEYGFPESHAASFALLAYASSWLKYHYPAAFCTALLNSQPMGFYAPAQLVRDVQAHDVVVLPVDVNHSRYDCTLEASGDSTLAIRLGLRMLKGISESAARCIEASQRAEPFLSLHDFTRRTGLSQAVVMQLAAADAFGSLGSNRRRSLWQALAQEKRALNQPLLAGFDADEPLIGLPCMSAQEEVVADYQSAGLSLKSHPLAFLRAELNEQRVVPARQLADMTNHQFVRVAGLVLVRQRPGTAKGITFVTLEDETGTANLIIRQDVWERFHRVAHTAVAMIAQGRLQKQEGIIHVLVARLEDVRSRLGKLPTASRDFH